MNRTYESVSTNGSNLLCTTSAYRTSQAISFNSIIHEGTVYLSIAHSPWRTLTEASYMTSDTDLDTLSTSNGDQVRESEEPLRSALLSLAAKRGEYWMKFDQRMDILAADALKRIQKFIDSQHLPPRRPAIIHYVTPEELDHIHGGSMGLYAGAGGSGGGSGRTAVGGGGDGGAYNGPYIVDTGRNDYLICRPGIDAPNPHGDRTYGYTYLSPNTESFQRESRLHRASSL